MNLTLKTKVVAATSILVALIMIGVTATGFAFFKSQLRRMIFMQQNTLVGQVAREADGKLYTARSQLEQLADLIASDAVRERGRLQKLLEREAHLCEIFNQGIFITAKDGATLAQVPCAPSPAAGEILRHQAVRDVIAAASGFSKPFKSPSGRPLVALAVPLAEKSGPVPAVMVGIIDLLNGNFLGNLPQARFGKDGYAFLFNSNRTLIIHPDERRIMTNPRAGLNPMFDKAVAGFEGSGETTTTYGKRMVVSFRHLTSTNWIVGVNYPADEAFAPIARAQQWFCVALIGTVLLSMTLIGLFMRRILRPLEAFAAHVAEMPGLDGTGGHFQAPCTGEIRTLADSFNRMVDRLASHQKQAQESEALFRSLVDNSAIPTFVIDADHIVIAWNRACEELTGIQAQEIIGTSDHWRGFYTFKRPTLADIVIDGCGEESSRYYGSLACSSLIPDGLRAESWLRGVAGKDRYVVFEAAPVSTGNTFAGAIETLQDLTERKLAEEKVTKLRDFYLTLFEGFPALIWRAGTDSMCDYFNKTWLDFTGRTVEQEMGNGWAEGVHPDDLDHCLAVYLEAFGLRKAFSMEYRLRHHSGEYRWILDIGRPFTDIDGEFAGYVGVCYDTTERKEADQTLAQSREELEQAYLELKRTQSQVLQQEKMASIGQLAAGVAHEINNPMGFIFSNLGTLRKYIERMVGYVQRVESLLPESGTEGAAAARKEMKIDYILDDIRQLIEESLEGAERVRKIVLDLKGFSRVDDVEDKLVDINSCLDSTLNIIWNEIKYVATLKKEYGDLPQVKCFPQQINQVFMNLLVNAAHAIEGQGEIVVRTWHDDTSVFAAVRDSGCGIAPDILNKIFEPFFTTKEVGKGTGLGLSITYDIIKKHNGEVTVTSEIGKGTEFVVRIPIGGEA